MAPRKTASRDETPVPERPEASKKNGKPDARDEDKDEELEALREQLAEARAKISLKTAPITTLRLFVLWLVDFTIYATKAVVSSYLTWFVAVPLLGGWVALKTTFAPHLFTPPVCGGQAPGILWSVEFAMTEAGWWIILGVLSSVGFGTGLHSGLMFLFPHIMQVVTAAEGCGTTQGLVPWYQHPCRLDCTTTSGAKDGSTVTFARLFLLVTVPAMLWGFGTAIGELPPYLVSKAARQAGSKDEEFEAELEEARTNTDLFSRMKVWTIDFTERNGFLGVFMLASWPNAAFDMCGMCCGYLLMPFWTFFLACALGKGVVKVNLQAVVFINLFGSAFFQVLLGGVAQVDAALEGIVGKDLALRTLLDKGRMKLVTQFQQQSRFPPERLLGGESQITAEGLASVYSKNFDNAEEVSSRVMQSLDVNGDARLDLPELQAAASRTDGKVSLSALDPGTGTSILKMCWELFIVGLVLFFVCSAASQLAKNKQAALDEAQLERRRKEKAKDK